MTQPEPVSPEYASVPAPSPQLPALPDWRRWVIFWAIGAIVLAALLSFNAKLDTFLWLSTRWAAGDGDQYTWVKYKAKNADNPKWFYQRDEPPMGGTFFRRTEDLWTLFKRLGEYPRTLIAIAIIAVFCKGRRLLALIAFPATIIPGVISWLIRVLDGRYRPTHIDGANHWDWFRGFSDGSNLAFPSGHATLVFATAAAMSYAFPKLRWLFIPIACGTALARVIQEAHFYSDVIMGGILGWSLGWWIMAYGERWALAMQTKLQQARPHV